MGDTTSNDNDDRSDHGVASKDVYIGCTIISGDSNTVHVNDNDSSGGGAAGSGDSAPGSQRLDLAHQGQFADMDLLAATQSLRRFVAIIQRVEGS